VTTWDELPKQIQDAVQDHVGPVATATAIMDGQNSDIAAVLHRPDAQPVFVKGVNGVSRRMRWLRNETVAAPLTQGLSPKVLFSQDIDGWLVVGFEYVTGRPANLAPASGDLAIVAKTVDRISALPGTGLRPLRDRWGVTDWWTKLAAEAPDTVQGWDFDEVAHWASRFPTLVDGDRLAHTDLHGDQFLIDDNTVHVIDWGYPGTGAPWADAAFLVLRLIEAGHAAADAEAWVHANVSCFSHADDECLTAFAVYIAGLWGYWAATGDISGAQGRARVAREYAAWRLDEEKRNLADSSTRLQQ
jgi:hypothetical protein